MTWMIRDPWTAAAHPMETDAAPSGLGRHCVRYLADQFSRNSIRWRGADCRIKDGSSFRCYHS